MDKKMKFKYFYGAEADHFSFYRIPKALFTDSYFKDLSSDAKILYGLMLDRMSLSIKNQMELIRSRNLPMERHLQRSAITEQKQVMRMVSLMRNIRIFRQERDSSLPISQRLMQMDPVTGHPEPMRQERTWQWNFTIIV